MILLNREISFPLKYWSIFSAVNLSVSYKPFKEYPRITDLQSILPESPHWNNYAILCVCGSSNCMACEVPHIISSFGMLLTNQTSAWNGLSPPNGIFMSDFNIGILSDLMCMNLRWIHRRYFHLLQRRLFARYIRPTVSPVSNLQMGTSDKKNSHHIRIIQRQ